jgi:hypothetical protein
LTRPINYKPCYDFASVLIRESDDSKTRITDGSDYTLTCRYRHTGDAEVNTLVAYRFGTSGRCKGTPLGAGQYYQSIAIAIPIGVPAITGYHAFPATWTVTGTIRLGIVLTNSGFDPADDGITYAQMLAKAGSNGWGPSLAQAICHAIPPEEAQVGGIRYALCDKELILITGGSHLPYGCILKFEGAAAGLGAGVYAEMSIAAGSVPRVIDYVCSKNL